MSTYLVFGATGGTGRHFVSLALNEGHTVRALVRNPAKVTAVSPHLTVQQGTIGAPLDLNPLDLDALVEGVDFVISMLGDKQLQRDRKINTEFVQKLIPAMRRHGVRRFLYQAGGLSAPPNAQLTPVLWAIRKTAASSFEGQHRDNEAVMQYLADEANDIEWMAHRAGIGSDGPSKGTLERSQTRPSIATFRDCAAYNYRILSDPTAIHTCDFSAYAKA